MSNDIYMPKRWLNPKELFQEFGISTSNQSKMRVNNQIPFSKVNNYIRYDRVEINKWLEDNKIPVKV